MGINSWGNLIKDLTNVYIYISIPKSFSPVILTFWYILCFMVGKGKNSYQIGKTLSHHMVESNTNTFNKSQISSITTEDVVQWYPSYFVKNEVANTPWNGSISWNAHKNIRIINCFHPLMIEIWNTAYSAKGPWNESLNLFTKYGIPKSFKVGHWLSQTVFCLYISLIFIFGKLSQNPHSFNSCPAVTPFHLTLGGWSQLLFSPSFDNRINEWDDCICIYIYHKNQPNGGNNFAPVGAGSFDIRTLLTPWL